VALESAGELIAILKQESWFYFIRFICINKVDQTHTKRLCAFRLGMGALFPVLSTFLNPDFITAYVLTVLALLRPNLYSYMCTQVNFLIFEYCDFIQDHKRTRISYQQLLCLCKWPRTAPILSTIFRFQAWSLGYLPLFHVPLTSPILWQIGPSILTTPR
jgi:hypothetical protein